MSVAHITQENFQKDVLDSKGVVFVDFYADWCGPCKVTEPIVEELAKEQPEVKFLKVDVDANPQLATQYSIFSIPTFMIFKDGKMAAQLVGARGKEGFVEELKKVTA